jgi:hypothetical protein
MLAMQRVDLAQVHDGLVAFQVSKVFSKELTKSALAAWAMQMEEQEDV